MIARDVQPTANQTICNLQCSADIGMQQICVKYFYEIVPLQSSGKEFIKKSGKSKNEEETKNRMKNCKQSELQQNCFPLKW